MTKSLIWLTFILVAFGLIMISSAGVWVSGKNFGTNYHYFKHQLIWGFLPGLALFLITSRIDYRKWKKLSLPLILISIGLLILVFLPEIGIAFRGARRWINLGFFSFQPSEILKLTLIIYLASWFSSRIYKSDISNSVAAFLVILFFISLFLIAQPDIGTLGIIIFIALAMFFVSGAGAKHFFGIILLISLFLFLVVGFSPYRFNRLLVFLNPGADVQGIGYHLNQSLISIGSGGLTGLGFGRGEQKLGFLPEPVGDSIFAVVGEELGFIGMGLTIGLILSLIILSISVAKRTADKFAFLYATGFASWIAVQSFVNIASLAGLIPLTGIPLPFISFGGTSLAVLMAAAGILVNMSQKA